MKKCGFIVFMVLLCAFLFGCQRVQTKTTEVSEKKEYINYSEKQMALLIISKMEEVQLAYGSPVWGKELDANGLIYKEEFLDEMKEFFVELKIMSMIAKQKGVRLTTEEEAKVGKVAGNFFDNLSLNPNLDFGISHEEVDAIFKEYALVQKTKVEVSKDVVDSVSEDDARVLNLQQIVLNSEEEMRKAVEELQVENADFYTIARQNSTESKINIEVGHEDLPSDVDKVVCELENGEVSQALLLDGKYHIYKCIEGYNTEATARKKKKMKNKVMNEEVERVYTEYSQRDGVKLDMQVWDNTIQMVELKFENLKSSSEHITFFSVYRDHFESNGL